MMVNEHESAYWNDPQRKWKKADESGDGGQCVLVSRDKPGSYAVKDSKRPDDSPVLVFDENEWNRLVAAAIGGYECDLVSQDESGLYLVRDSKLGDDSPVLVFDGGEWAAFTAALNRKEDFVSV